MQKIWKATVGQQSLEIEKAICNQINEFRIASHIEYLPISFEHWLNMSRQSQETYIEQFRMMGNCDIKNKKILLFQKTRPLKYP